MHTLTLLPQVFIYCLYFAVHVHFFIDIVNHYLLFLTIKALRVIKFSSCFFIPSWFNSLNHYEHYLVFLFGDYFKRRFNRFSLCIPEALQLCGR